MADLARRLARVKAQMGVCATHGAPMACPACDVPEPLPEPLATMLDRLISAIATRVGAEGLRAIMRRVPRPEQRLCEHCGGSRQCGDCKVRYAQAVFGHIGLTAAEQAMLDTVLAECRVQDSKRG
jgi:hypothetical protein